MDRTEMTLHQKLDALAEQIDRQEVKLDASLTMTTGSLTVVLQAMQALTAAIAGDLGDEVPPAEIG
jgi:hypothetical protein